MQWLVFAAAAAHVFAVTFLLSNQPASHHDCLLVLLFLCPWQPALLACLQQALLAAFPCCCCCCCCHCPPFDGCKFYFSVAALLYLSLIGSSLHNDESCTCHWLATTLSWCCFYYPITCYGWLLPPGGLIVGFYYCTCYYCLQNQFNHQATAASTINPCCNGVIAIAGWLLAMTCHQCLVASHCSCDATCCTGAKATDVSINIACCHSWF